MSELDGWAERRRIAEQGRGERPWSLWGPYLSERQWGTVREDYSRDGNAWRSLPHEEARSRAYRWGEDGLAGICDERGQLCLVARPLERARPHPEGAPVRPHQRGGQPRRGREGGLPLPRRGPEPRLPEVPLPLPARRLPLRRPRARGPAARPRRSRNTRSRRPGIFDDDRFFDVTVEYAKEDVDDIHVVITATNRGPEAADLHLVPQLWFRNTWSWRDGPRRRGARARAAARRRRRLRASAPRRLPPDLRRLARTRCSARTTPTCACTAGSRTRRARSRTACTRRSSTATTAPCAATAGTKLGLHYALPASSRARRRGSRLRLSAGHAACARSTARAPSCTGASPRPTPSTTRCRTASRTPDARAIFRQAAAGLIWSKQLYCLRRPALARRATRSSRRRRGSATAAATSTGATSPAPTCSRCRTSGNIPGSPPGTSPSTACRWPCSIRTSPRSSSCCSPANGTCTRTASCPAYEWEFGDANPPVHAWATYRVFEIDRDRRGGRGDLAFLEGVFHKLLINFTWWVNRKDADGRNVFQGGFLGLDNVGVFDRSRPPPGFGRIHQADGTAWMAMYALNMMRIALELALHNDVYESTASKFFEHFLLIAEAMTDMGGEGFGLWDEEDEFYYDEVDIPGGGMLPLRVRSVVGLVPLFAVEVIEPVGAPAPAGLRPAPELGAGEPPAPRLPRLALGRGRRRRPQAAVAAARTPHEGAAAAHARRGRVPLGPRRPLAVEGAPRPALRAQRVRRLLHGALRSGRFRPRTCSAATRTGAGRSGCR